MNTVRCTNIRVKNLPSTSEFCQIDLVELVVVNGLYTMCVCVYVCAHTMNAHFVYNKHNGAYCQEKRTFLMTHTHTNSHIMLLNCLTLHTHMYTHLSTVLFNLEHVKSDE